MEQRIFRVNGSAVCPAPYESLKLSQVLTLERLPSGGVKVSDASGRQVGAVTARHELARALADEATIVLHASVNMVRGPDKAYPYGKLHVRAMLGVAGEVYAAPVYQSPTIYPVGIVGESFYQPAIRKCRVGDRVVIWHDANNPHDALALAVRTLGGEMIGHIPRNCWVQDVVHRDGKGVSATILAINDRYRVTGVVLRVVLADEPVKKWPPSASLAAAVSKISVDLSPTGGRRSWLARLFDK